MNISQRLANLSKHPSLSEMSMSIPTTSSTCSNSLMDSIDSPIDSSPLDTPMDGNSNTNSNRRIITRSNSTNSNSNSTSTSSSSSSTCIDDKNKDKDTHTHTHKTLKRNKPYKEEEEEQLSSEETEIREMLDIMSKVPQTLSPIPEDVYTHTLTPKKRLKTNTSNNNAKEVRKSPSKLQTEARKLKDIAKKMANDAKPVDDPSNLDSYWYYFQSGLKFIEFGHALSLSQSQSQSQKKEAADLFLSTASFFNFCIHKYDKVGRRYLQALGFACKIWCYFQSFSLRKTDIFKSCAKSAQILEFHEKAKREKSVPNSAGSCTSTEWSPSEHPGTPSSSVCMSKNSFGVVKKYVERDTKGLMGAFSGLEAWKSVLPAKDIVDQYSLSVLPLERVLFAEEMTTLEFVQHIKSEIEKGKDICY